MKRIYLAALALAMMAAPAFAQVIGTAGIYQRLIAAFPGQSGIDPGALLPGIDGALLMDGSIPAAKLMAGIAGSTTVTTTAPVSGDGSPASPVTVANGAIQDDHIAAVAVGKITGGTIPGNVITFTAGGVVFAAPVADGVVESGTYNNGTVTLQRSGALANVPITGLPRVEPFATVGTTAIITTGRLAIGGAAQQVLTRTNTSHHWANATGLTQTQTDARVRVGVSDWAESGDTSAIPANKLTNAPGGGTGTTVVANPGTGTTLMVDMTIGTESYAMPHQVTANPAGTTHAALTGLDISGAQYTVPEEVVYVPAADVVLTTTPNRYRFDNTLTPQLGHIYVFAPKATNDGPVHIEINGVSYGVVKAGEPGGEEAFEGGEFQNALPVLLVYDGGGFNWVGATLGSAAIRDVGTDPLELVALNANGRIDASLLGANPTFGFALKHSNAGPVWEAEAGGQSQADTDARYVRKSGDTMEGNLVVEHTTGTAILSRVPDANQTAYQGQRMGETFSFFSLDGEACGSNTMPGLELGIGGTSARDVYLCRGGDDLLRTPDDFEARSLDVTAAGLAETKTNLEIPANAAGVPTDVTEFNGPLGASDINVQIALDVLDTAVDDNSIRVVLSEDFLEYELNEGSDQYYNATTNFTWNGNIYLATADIAIHRFRVYAHPIQTDRGDRDYYGGAWKVRRDADLTTYPGEPLTYVRGRIRRGDSGPFMTGAVTVALDTDSQLEVQFDSAYLVQAGEYFVLAVHVTPAGPDTLHSQAGIIETSHAGTATYPHETIEFIARAREGTPFPDQSLNSYLGPPLPGGDVRPASMSFDYGVLNAGVSTIRDEGSEVYHGLTHLNFAGAGVTATHDSVNDWAEITIPGVTLDISGLPNQSSTILADVDLFLTEDVSDSNALKHVTLGSLVDRIADGTTITATGGTLSTAGTGTVETESPVSGVGSTGSPITIADGALNLVHMSTGARYHRGDWNSNQVYIRGQSVEHVNHLWINAAGTSLGDTPAADSTIWYRIDHRPTAISDQGTELVENASSINFVGGAVTATTVGTAVTVTVTGTGGGGGAVETDGTLDGDGSTGAPLGIADRAVTRTKIAHTAIHEELLDMLNDPVDDYVIGYDIASGRMEWVDNGAGGGGGGGGTEGFTRIELGSTTLAVQSGGNDVSVALVLSEAVTPGALLHLEITTGTGTNVFAPGIQYLSGLFSSDEYLALPAVADAPNGTTEDGASSLIVALARANDDRLPTVGGNLTINRGLPNTMYVRQTAYLERYGAGTFKVFELIPGGGGAADGVVDGGSYAGGTLTLTRSEGDPVTVGGLTQPFDLHDDFSQAIVALSAADRLVLSDESINNDPNRFMATGSFIDGIRDVLNHSDEHNPTPQGVDRIFVSDESRTFDPMSYVTVDELAVAVHPLTPVRTVDPLLRPTNAQHFVATGFSGWADKTLIFASIGRHDDVALNGDIISQQATFTIFVADLLALNVAAADMLPSAEADTLTALSFEYLLRTTTNFAALTIPHVFFGRTAAGELLVALGTNAQGNMYPFRATAM